MKKSIKIFSKFICLALALVTCFSVSACKKIEIKGDDVYNYVDTSTYPENTEGLYDINVHDFTAPVIADKWLVKNGKTEYKLVVPASSPRASLQYFNYFINEFAYFFNEATNIAIEIVTDASIPNQEHSADQHYISVGHTTLLESTDIDYTSAEVYTRVGGTVDTIDNNIYITGRFDEGTLSAVYSFFKVTFNYEVFSANTFVIDRNCTDVPLRDYAVVDIPDAEYIPGSSYETETFVKDAVYTRTWRHSSYDANMFGARIRALQNYREAAQREIMDRSPEEAYADKEYIKTLAQTSGHNNLDLVPPAKWGADHPDWMGTGNVQLCYTTHGNEEEYEALTQKLADAFALAYMLSPTEEYPLSQRLQLTNVDSYNMCACDECKKESARLGGHGGLQLKFVNRVAEKLDAWMQEQVGKPWYRDDWYIRFSAYNNTMNPPVIYDPITETYQPIDEDCVANEHVLIEWAPHSIDFQQSYLADTNAAGLQMLEGWSAIADNRVCHYTYLTIIRSPNYFFDVFDFLSTKSQNYAIHLGRAHWYTESFHGTAPTEWGALQTYIQSNIAYNSKQDTGKLMKKFFENVYGPASSIMYNFFTSQRIFVHDQALKSDSYVVNSSGNGVDYSYNWTVNVFKSWIAEADKAHEAIAYLKDIDFEAYDRYSYNIELEAFSPMVCMLINPQTQNNLTNAEVYEVINRIRSNLDRWAEFEHTKTGRGIDVLDFLANYA